MRRPTPSPAQQRRDRWQEAYIEARRSGSGVLTLIELADQEQANLHAEVARLHAELHDAESGCVDVSPKTARRAASTPIDTPAAPSLPGEQPGGQR